MKITKLMAVCFGTVGICVVLTGIAIEVSIGADFGFALITAGSVIVAGGCVLYAQIIRRKG